MANLDDVIVAATGTRSFSPPPGSGTSDFGQAYLLATIFYAACAAGCSKSVLRSLSKTLSPLAVEILLWIRDEMAASTLQPDQDPI